jgi:hypothetical protein
MKLNQLEKASKHLEQLKKLDKDILGIEKIAEIIANGITKSYCTFSLKVTDILKKEEDKNEVYFDSDGSLVFEKEQNHSPFGMGIFHMFQHKN